MSEGGKFAAAFELLAARAQGDARALAGLAATAHARGLGERAYALAMQARALAPNDRDVRSMTELAITAGVPGWHFGIVRDDARNAAYDAALKRAVTPETRVLDIGAGTGLLAMMAARAGAAAVVTCEMNPAVADAAAEIVALNGLAGRVRVVAKHSSALDADADLGGRADLLVCEIVSADLIGEMALPVMADVVPRLLKPGAQVIPCAGQIRVALAHWDGLEARRLSEVAGFDVSPFNRLDRFPRKLPVGDPALALRGAPADLFRFDFASGRSDGDGRTSLDLIADGGPINGVSQWIRLQMDAAGAYENRPGPGAASCWTSFFHPFERALDPAPGTTVRIEAAHTRSSIRIWSEA